jgi:DNA polymerase theta
MNLSWAGSSLDGIDWIGSDLLAEISLLEANAQVNNENQKTSAPLHTERTSIVASSSHSATVHEKSSLGNASVSLDLNSHSQCSRLSTNTNASCSASIAGLLGSNPSEIKSGTSSVLDKQTNSLSASVHSSPLSCSTPVANSAASLRKASLRPSSKLNLQNWGLPSAVVQKYAEKNITTLFPWQVDCLQTEKVLVGGNLIYSAPTSSGKTLVSELLMLKTVVDLKKKGM